MSKSGRYGRVLGGKAAAQAEAAPACAAPAKRKDVLLADLLQHVPRIAAPGADHLEIKGIGDDLITVGAAIEWVSEDALKIVRGRISADEWEPIRKALMPYRDQLKQLLEMGAVKAIADEKPPTRVVAEQASLLGL